MDFHAKMRRSHQTGRPKLACEIAQDRVIAARAADSGQVLELCSTSELAPGSVVPDLTEANLRERNSVVSALRETLGNLAARSRDLVDVRTISIAILDQKQLLLFRTLENARGVTISGEQLAEDVYPSIVFFQDTYNTSIAEIFVAGVSDLTDTAPALHSQTGAEVKELVRASQLGLGGGSIPKWRMAGVVGALLSTN